MLPQAMLSLSITQLLFCVHFPSPLASALKLANDLKGEVTLPMLTFVYGLIFFSGIWPRGPRYLTSLPPPPPPLRLPPIHRDTHTNNDLS